MLALKKYFGLFLAVLFLSFLYTGCGTPAAARPDAPKSAPLELGFLEKLKALLLQDDVKGALALFDTLTETEALKDENQLLKASVLISDGRFNDARQIANALIAKDSGNIDARYVLANVEQADGKPKERRLLLEKIIADKPDFIPALNDLGRIAVGTKSYKKASGYYDSALSIDGSNLDALTGRANVYRLQRMSKEALALLTQALKLEPNNPVVLGERGRLNRECGNLKDALADLDAAIKITPDDYWIIYDHARTLLDMNRRSEALAEFDYIEKLEPNNFIAFVYSAGLRDESGDAQGAAHDYAILAQLRPDYYFAFEGLGVQFIKLKKYAQARDAFAQAYKQAPTENNYALLAAICALRAGEKPAMVKNFVEQAMRKIDRSKVDYHVLRLFFDFSGDADVAHRVDIEKNERTKAMMLFYLGNYYDIRGNNILADHYYSECKETKRMDMVEWNINEWILQERGIMLGQKID